MKRIRKTICLLLFGLFAALSNQVLAAEDTFPMKSRQQTTLWSHRPYKKHLFLSCEVEQLQTDLQESNLMIPLELDVAWKMSQRLFQRILQQKLGLQKTLFRSADHETSLTDEIHSSVAGNEEGEAKVDGQSDPELYRLDIRRNNRYCDRRG